eukprot:13914975-Alexandrium_andersonii.AAC.1
MATHAYAHAGMLPHTSTYTHTCTCAHVRSSALESTRADANACARADALVIGHAHARRRESTDLCADGRWRAR